jgi:hypothetical protein
MHRPKSDRIAILEKRIWWLEQYPHGNANDSIKQLKEELQTLQAEEEKRDRLRGVPLLSSKITGYRFFCSPCWDQAYLIDQNQRKKQRVRHDTIS